MIETFCITHSPMKKTLLAIFKFLLGEVISVWISALPQRLVMADSPVCQSHSSHPFFSPETGAAHLPFQPSGRGKALSKTMIVSMVPILCHFRQWPTLLVPSSSFGFYRIAVLKIHVLCGQG